MGRRTRVLAALVIEEYDLGLVEASGQPLWDECFGMNVESLQICGYNLLAVENASSRQEAVQRTGLATNISSLRFRVHTLHLS